MSQVSNRRRRHKKNKNTKLILGSIAAVGIVAVGGYALGSTYYSKHFLPNTQVEAVEISNMSLEQAQKTMDDQHKNQTFQIKLDNQVVKEFKKSDFGMESNFKATLESILDAQNPCTSGVIT